MSIPCVIAALANTTHVVGQYNKMLQTLHAGIDDVLDMKSYLLKTGEGEEIFSESMGVRKFDLFSNFRAKQTRHDRITLASKCKILKDKAHAFLKKDRVE